MEEEYQELIQTFTTIIHIDVVPPLIRLLRPIDFLYHGDGASKRRVIYILIFLSNLFAAPFLPFDYVFNHY